MRRGTLHKKKGDFERALADYTKAIEIDPNYDEPHNQRCWLRATANRDLPLALGDCDRAIAIDPEDADYVNSRGLVYLRLDRLDDAIADYDTALRLKPKLAGSLYGRGLAKQRKGDQAGGEADIAAAKAIKADIAEEFAKWGVQ